MNDFIEFPKMARLSREVLITEKIDGTNGCLLINDDGLFVGSRTRWISPADDNHNFARWAREHEVELLTLGHGLHFGEWWGSGIQRGYGLRNGEKRFSLFNAIRWCPHGAEPQRILTADPRIVKFQDVAPACCHIVPILWRGIFDTAQVDFQLCRLRVNGSEAAPGFMQPEGVVVYHMAGGVGFKKTLLKDDEYKGKGKQ